VRTKENVSMVPALKAGLQSVKVIICENEGRCKRCTCGDSCKGTNFLIGV
jgi:hypothetical protein